MELALDKTEEDIVCAAIEHMGDQGGFFWTNDKIAVANQIRMSVSKVQLTLEKLCETLEIPEPGLMLYHVGQLLEWPVLTQIPSKADVHLTKKSQSFLTAVANTMLTTAGYTPEFHSSMADAGFSNQGSFGHYLSRSKSAIGTESSTAVIAHFIAYMMNPVDLTDEAQSSPAFASIVDGLSTSKSVGAQVRRYFLTANGAHPYSDRMLQVVDQIYQMPQGDELLEVTSSMTDDFFPSNSKAAFDIIAKGLPKVQVYNQRWYPGVSLLTVLKNLHTNLTAMHERSGSELPIVCLENEFAMRYDPPSMENPNVNRAKAQPAFRTLKPY